MAFVSRLCSPIWHFSCYLLLIFGAHKVANSQSFEYQAHPCHYIILVDASRSTISKATKPNYDKALEEALLRLYDKGFEESIPPFDPKQDFLTLLNFGVIIKSQVPAYLDLRNYDLSSQFIHPVILRQGNIEINDLRRQIAPHVFYEFTVLSWARQMALWSLQNQSSATTNHRTFLIMVSDGIANENSLKAEINMVEQWGNPDNVKKASEIVGSVNHEYQFIEWHDVNGKTKRVQINEGEGYHPVFIEAYEIKSKAQLAWEAEVKQLEPFKRVIFSWTKESGNQPVGTLHATIDDGFINWLRSNQVSTGLLKLVHDDQVSTAPWNFDSSLSLSTVFTGALSCEQKSYKAVIEVPITRQDNLLGTMTLLYSYDKPDTTPMPFKCTLASSVWWWIKTLLIAIIFAAISYYAYYRFLVTHIKVELPSLAIKIPIGRSGNAKRETPIPPASGTEAFSLLLPKGWMQSLLYRNARLTIQGDSNIKLELPNAVDKLTFKLPISETRIPALWVEAPATPIEVRVIFQQGKQHSEVNLSFPKAV